MHGIKLHESGRDDHVKALKKTYAALQQKIKGNTTLSGTEKDIELETLTNSFKKEKQNSNKNSY